MHSLFFPSSQCNVSVLVFSLGTDTLAILHFGNITDKVLTLLTNLLMLHFFSEGTIAYQEAWGFHFHVKSCCKKNSASPTAGQDAGLGNKHVVVFGARHWFKVTKLKLSLLLRRSPVFSEQIVQRLHRQGREAEGWESLMEPTGTAQRCYSSQKALGEKLLSQGPLPAGELLQFKEDPMGA